MGDNISPPDSGTDIKERQKHEVKEPEMYKVLLLNDDFTPKEFVVEILRTIFHRSRSDAWRVMLTAHTTGKAVVGLYTYDIANTKVGQSKQKAREAGYPLEMAIEGA